MNTYTVSIAGSTQHTRMCAEALLADGRFEVTWILTPQPKPIGRKQVLTANSLHLLAQERNIPTILIDKKIDQSVKTQILRAETPPDFLLVVDFGYFIPEWLLELPRIAPLNIHPSLLPRWRGSSPGQFVLMNGEKESAVTLMIMNMGMDTGPVVEQILFAVENTWTQTEYYNHSFTLVSKVLAQTIVDLAEGKRQPQAQPPESPTPIARRLSKEDGFIDWSCVQSAMIGQKDAIVGTTSALVMELYSKSRHWPQVIAHASKGLMPWPTLWTIIPTLKGPKRMQILGATTTDNEVLLLERVKIEGQNESNWKQVESLISQA